MKKIVASLCLALIVSACQSNRGMRSLSNQEALEPVRPGATRITFKNQDKDHWVASKNGDAIVLTCRFLGCPANTVVSYKTIASTRNPDHTAILTLAQGLIDHEVDRGATIMIKPQLGKYKNYTSVVFAWSHIKNDKVIYDYRKLVFAGNVAISFHGASLDKGFVQKAVDQFLGMIEVEDGGSIK